MNPSMLAALFLAAQPVSTPAAPPAPYADLEGAWVVDLSVGDGEDYTQPMVLKIAADKVVTGEFYNSTIESGRAGQNQGRRCVSFETSDGVGPYYHAACLIDGKMVGQSWAEHRKFVLPWSAQRPTTP